ncbi:hypothetical protein EJ08DRAFT_680973 [Tothia fuscella]|uniref:Protein kinase domain-containing protein n=1 Tax=Tothia fuscella TaxID=1048955 RepID=A0A9P4NMP2_9PEZI|nr:hypothetical protein EJ08DRAFT_680973 [Tothia fuscella]
MPPRKGMSAMEAMKSGITKSPGKPHGVRFAIPAPGTGDLALRDKSDDTVWRPPIPAKATLDAEFFCVKKLPFQGQRGEVLYAIKRPEEGTQKATKGEETAQEGTTEQEEPEIKETAEIDTKLFVVKLLRRDEIERSMQNEAMKLQQLRKKPGWHSSLVLHLESFDTTSPCYWYAMNVIPGPRLNEFIGGRSFKGKGWNAIPPAFTYHVFVELLETLEWLHSSKGPTNFAVTHNDLHYGNIMLDMTHAETSNGDSFPGLSGVDAVQYLPRVILIDFGLADIHGAQVLGTQWFENSKEAIKQDIKRFGDIIHGLAHNLPYAQQCREQEKGDCLPSCPWRTGEVKIPGLFDAADPWFNSLMTETAQFSKSLDNGHTLRNIRNIDTSGGKVRRKDKLNKEAYDLIRNAYYETALTVPPTDEIERIYKRAMAERAVEDEKSRASIERERQRRALRDAEASPTAGRESKRPQDGPAGHPKFWFSCD